MKSIFDIAHLSVSELSILLKVLEGALQNEQGNGIQVAGVRLTPDPQSLEGGVPRQLQMGIGPSSLFRRFP